MHEALLYKPQGGGGDGWNAGADPRTQQNNFQGILGSPVGRGPNFGVVGGNPMLGFLGLGFNAPMAQGYNPNAGINPTPMMSRTDTPAPQAQPWNDPDQSGGGFGGRGNSTSNGGYTDGGSFSGV